MSEQWEVGTRNLNIRTDNPPGVILPNREYGFFTGTLSEVHEEYERRVARSNKRKRPDGLLHFYRRATGVLA